MEFVIVAGFSACLVYDCWIKKLIFQEVAAEAKKSSPSEKKTIQIEIRPDKKIDSSEEEDCTICMESLTGLILTTNCVHEFHLKCLSDWMNLNNTCPHCRRPLIMP